MNWKNYTFMVVISMLCGLLGAFAFSQTLAKSFAEIPDKLKIRHLQIADEDDSVRIAFWIQDGDPMGCFYDKSGGGRLFLSLDDGLSPSISLYDSTGERSITIAVLEDVRPTIFAQDRIGRYQYMLTTGSDGSMIQVGDNNTGRSAAITSDPRLSLLDGFGNRRFEAYLQDDASPELDLLDESGIQRLSLGGVSLMSKKTGGTEKRATSSIVLFDKEGTVLLALPL